MNVPHKFIKTLSQDEHHQLVEHHQKAKTFRTRNRAHAILLSFQRYSIDEIAKICQVHRNAVSRWLKGWTQFGVKGLSDGQRSGRPKILTPEQEDKVIEIALQNPRFPSQQISEIIKQTGKPITIYTLKDLLKKKTICGNESS